jgi:membrane-bound lytic murein transglycosylase B
MKKYIVSIVLCLITAMLSITVYAQSDAKRTLTPQEKQFITSLAHQYKFSKTALTHLLESTTVNQKVLSYMDKPYESQPWAVYRRHFIKPQRIEGGVDYWKKHKDTLEEAYKKYQVPPQVIVAIIGVESHYGKHTGAFNALNALTTLSFYYPRRAKFFKRELTSFLLMTRQLNIPP